MTSIPAPGTASYDQWLDDQQARAQDVLTHEELERDEQRIAALSADEAISQAVRDELTVALVHAVQWLDVPTVLRVVADTVAAMDLVGAPRDDDAF